jgi:hypothetical protein
LSTGMITETFIFGSAEMKAGSGVN